MNLRRQRSSSQVRSHRLLAIEQLLPQSEGRGRDIVGGGFGGPVLGHQFPPAQFADSLALLSEILLGLAIGKGLRHPSLFAGLFAKTVSFPFDVSGQNALSLPALYEGVAIWIADKQGRIV